MSEEKLFEVTCIVCPIGCEIKVRTIGNNIISIEGNRCIRGKEYAIQEVIEPKRTVIAVIKCIGGYFPTVSVKSSKPVKKQLIPEIIKLLSKVEVKSPVKVGDIVIHNVLNSGADMIVTRSSSFS